MPVPFVRDYLEQEHVKYAVVHHPRSFTAQEVASVAHIPGRSLAKTVMISMDGQLAMAVVSANERVDLLALQLLTGSDRVRLVGEEEFSAAMPELEPGAIPPFGQLWGMPVYASRALTHTDPVALSAGTHTEVLSVAFRDFLSLARPTFLDFGRPA